MNSGFILTEDAGQDLDEIVMASYLGFGLKQALKTQSQINTALHDLGENPGIGHLREDLAPSDGAIRFKTVMKRFVIVYQAETQPICVIGVFDGAQDIAAVLPGRS